MIFCGSLTGTCCRCVKEVTVYVKAPSCLLYGIDLYCEHCSPYDGYLTMKKGVVNIYHFDGQHLTRKL